MKPIYKEMTAVILKYDNVLFIWPDKCKKQNYIINLTKDLHVYRNTYWYNESTDKMRIITKIFWWKSYLKVIFYNFFELLTF